MWSWMVKATSSLSTLEALHISRTVLLTCSLEQLVCPFLTTSAPSNDPTDYAAPEVLAGKPYRGKEQDVWALGILLYTIVYKENPFYSIDEIMDRDLRVPYVMSDDSIDLIRAMLDRDVDSRITIEKVLEHPWCLAIDDE